MDLCSSSLEMILQKDVLEKSFPLAFKVYQDVVLRVERISPIGAGLPFSQEMFQDEGTQDGEPA